MIFMQPPGLISCEVHAVPTRQSSPVSTLLTDELRLSFSGGFLMSTARTLLAFSLAVLMTSTSAFAGQQHLVSPEQLATTVADDAAKQDMNRATVRQALERPEVQAVASKFGLDVTRATEAVNAMSGADLEKAADAAQQVNEQLVGGASSVVISTTTIIIILLVLILLIVALK
jgi:hypothetical protein